MEYSNTFISKIKEVYPDYPKLIELAKQGSVWLGRYLDDMSSGDIQAKTILSATDLQELKDLARKHQAKRELYAMWCKEYDKRNP